MNYNNLTLEALVYIAYYRGKEIHINDGSVIAITDREIDIPNWIKKEMHYGA